jgi:hypothetical protein
VLIKINKEYITSAISPCQMGRACSTNGGEEECILDIGGKARKKETTRNTRRRWVDNIKMDFRETGWDGMDWIVLAQDRDQ